MNPTIVEELEAHCNSILRNLNLHTLRNVLLHALPVVLSYSVEDLKTRRNTADGTVALTGAPTDRDSWLWDGLAMRKSQSGMESFQWQTMAMMSTVALRKAVMEAESGEVVSELAERAKQAFWRALTHEPYPEEMPTEDLTEVLTKVVILGLVVAHLQKQPRMIEAMLEVANLEGVNVLVASSTLFQGLENKLKGDHERVQEPEPEQEPEQMKRWQWLLQALALILSLMTWVLTPAVFWLSVLEMVAVLVLKPAQAPVVVPVLVLLVVHALMPVLALMLMFWYVARMIEVPSAEEEPSAKERWSRGQGVPPEQVLWSLLTAFRAGNQGMPVAQGHVRTIRLSWAFKPMEETEQADKKTRAERDLLCTVTLRDDDLDDMAYLRIGELELRKERLCSKNSEWAENGLPLFVAETLPVSRADLVSLLSRPILTFASCHLALERVLEMG